MNVPRILQAVRARVVTLLLGTSLVLSASCERHPAPSAANNDPQAVDRSVRTAGVPVALAATAAAVAPTYTVRVVNSWPHDPNAFTQGLIYLKGILIETTGLNGRSSLRKVELETGKVRELVKIPAEYFGEGMTVLNDKVFVLTWQNHKGFVYDLQTFQLEKEFSYTGEGWGLTTDGRSLILSDGTNEIRFLDPETFQVTRSIRVMQGDQPLRNLNELEFIRGEIFANVWQTNTIVRIDPATGRLIGIVDCTGLLPQPERLANTDVLNGIAFDAGSDRLFLTGKNWPKLFEVELKQK